LEERRLLSIQYLRAFAACAVVLFHTCEWGRRSFFIGAAGVDIFFVISGFILWTIAAERPTPPGTFLLRRLARVAPLYWIMTWIVVVLSVLAPSMFFGPPQTWDDIVLSFAFIQHLNAEGGPFPVISAGWTLNYEALFYILFVISLMAPVAWRFRVLAAGLVAVPVFGFIVPKAHILIANMLFLQFLAGAWLARQRLERGLYSRKVGWVMVVWALALFAMLTPFDLFTHPVRTFIWGVPAFVLVAGLVTVEARGGLREIGWLKLLGDASYAIYVSHLITIEAVTHFMERRDFIYVPIAATLAILVGIGVHKWIERPLLNWLKPGGRKALPLPMQV